MLPRGVEPRRGDRQLWAASSGLSETAAASLMQLQKTAWGLGVRDFEKSVLRSRRQSRGRVSVYFVAPGAKSSKE